MWKYAAVAITAAIFFGSLIACSDDGDDTAVEDTTAEDTAQESE
jgi:hypothetical protein